MHDHLVLLNIGNLNAVTPLPFANSCQSAVVLYDLLNSLFTNLNRLSSLFKSICLLPDSVRTSAHLCATQRTEIIQPETLSLQSFTTPLSHPVKTDTPSEANPTHLLLSSGLGRGPIRSGLGRNAEINGIFGRLRCACDLLAVGGEMGGGGGGGMCVYRVGEGGVAVGIGVGGVGGR